MPLPDGYVRVSRRHPCPICGKRDWCLLARDGSVAICPRVPDGAKKFLGESGYLHELQDNRPPSQRVSLRRIEPEPETTINVRELLTLYWAAMTNELMENAAIALGVSSNSLINLDIGWDGDSGAHTFPMRNADGEPIGIRLRDPINGRKWAVRGSRSGLFIPSITFDIHGTLIVCEGPTDTAAMLTLGFQCIGRPFCRGGVADIIKFTNVLNSRVVIVADADGPGVDGAHALADALIGRAVKVIKPRNAKDAREWLQNGVTREGVEAVVENTPLWQRKAAA